MDDRRQIFAPVELVEGEIIGPPNTP